MSAAQSAAAVSRLEDYLAQAEPRPELAQQPFAMVPLTRDDATHAQTLLWDDLARSIRATRKDEVGATESVARTIPGSGKLGPRMAERWAGAGMSAGHPNSASPLNLRNLAFAIHVGGDDTMFDRNKKAEEWGKLLESLAAADPGGYVNQWKVHAGLPHWMNMEDAVSVPFLQAHTRDPYPSKVVWRQAEVTRPHLYWLAVESAQQKLASEVRASYAADTISITGVKDLSRLTVRLTDQMLDLISRCTSSKMATSSLRARRCARSTCSRARSQSAAIPRWSSAQRSRSR